MKKYDTSMETISILEAADGAFAIVMNHSAGQRFVVAPGAERPEVYPTLAAATAVVDRFGGVVARENEQYAYAFDV